MSTPPRTTRELSANQSAKRDWIVAAAVEVLIRSGVHGCTVRAIADQAGVSKGVVHYYYEDVDEIVDAAMLRATRAWIAWFSPQAAPDSGLPPVGAVGESPPVPRPARARSARENFFKAMEACLAPFAHGDRALLPLWLEYWALRTRHGALQPLSEMERILVGFVTDLLREVGVPRAAERARGVTAYLFGVAMVQSVDPIGPSVVRRQLAALAGL